jgi:hypothetical protein
MAARAANPMRIIVEPESPGDSRSLFRILLGEKLIGEELTAAEAHLLVGEILERIALPKNSETLARIGR